MKLHLAAAALLALTAMSAEAKERKPLELVPGMVFYAPDKTAVGTIREVYGTAVVVDTGSRIATLGLESFFKGKPGPTIGYTKAELDAAIDAIERDREARLTAAIVAGRELRSNDGEKVGMVQAVNTDGSVVIVQEKRAFTLQRSQLEAQGAALIVRFSAAQLEAALKAAAGG